MTDEGLDIPDDLDDLVNELVHEQGYAGAALVVTSEEHTDVYGEIAEDRDPQFVAHWLLGAFITHVTATARESGGMATLETVAARAIQLVGEYSE